MRLDKFLYSGNFVTSRNKAISLIKNGKIVINGKVILKPSYNIDNLDCEIDILEEKIYVSRAAYKLKAFLDNNFVDIKDKICLDIGSSTGGFTQILLEFGAKEVYAVDVGTNQLDKSLKDDFRVKSFEKTDIRNFKSNKKFNLVTCDVSFVGVENILDDIERFSEDEIILLFKPQFEVGKDAKRDRRGVVKDKDAVQKAVVRFESAVNTYGWNLLCKEESRIKGKEGNVETFYHFKKR